MARKPRSEDWAELQDTPMLEGHTVYEPDDGLSQAPAFVRFSNPKDAGEKRTRKRTRQIGKWRKDRSK